MRTARFLPSQIWTIAQADQGNAVFIRPNGGDIVLPVYVSESDIQTILVELTHVLAPRPMVHELMLTAIESLHGKLDRVEIYGIRSGTYLCRIVLKQGTKEIYLESRPSDILCLSARLECPVNVDDTVLLKNGIPIERLSVKPETDRVLSDVEYLQDDLKTAIDKEDYEMAAVLRDRILDLSRRDDSRE